MAENEPKPFNPNEHLMQIKNKGGATDYLPVQWRLVWFRSLCPNGTIETEMVHLDLDRETEEEGYAWNNETRRSEKVIKRAPGLAVFRATVTDGKGGVASGTKSEKAASFPDFIEKAETGSIGRALAALGYGTQFTGDEFNEHHRIVDAPVDPSSIPVENSSNGQRPASGTETDQQSESIKQMISKAQNRAKSLGMVKIAEWNRLIADALGTMKTSEQLTLQDIAKINGALTSREKEKQVV